MHRHLLFSMMKTAALNVNPFKSYSKHTHPTFLLKWAVTAPTPLISATGILSLNIHF